MEGRCQPDWAGRVAALRRAAGETQASRRTGLGPSTLSRIENGVVRRLHSRTLHRLAAGYGLAADLLFRGHATPALLALWVRLLLEEIAAQAGADVTAEDSSRAAEQVVLAIQDGREPGSKSDPVCNGVCNGPEDNRG